MSAPKRALRTVSYMTVQDPTSQATRWLYLHDIATMLGRSRTQARRITLQAGFPAPYQWSDGAQLQWLAGEFDEWQELRRQRAPINLHDPEPSVLDRRRGPRQRTS